MNIYNRIPYHVSKGAQKNYNIYLREAEREYKKKKPTRVIWEDIVANAILFKATDKLFGRKNQDPIGDTNIKSHTVAYTLSLLHELTDGKIDLGKIWNKQVIDESFKIELKKGLIYVYKFFTSLNVLLISEAAKSEKTWIKLLEQKMSPFNLEILKPYIIDEKGYKQRYDQNEDDSAEIRKYDNLKRISDLGIRFWDGLFKYNIRTNILSKYEDNMLSSIRRKMKFSGNFTENEISVGVRIIEKVEQLKVNFKDITILSEFDESESIDPSALYNRLLLIDDSKWRQIIDLGEQTGTLTFKELSVIKTVRQKLKRKENIDLKRMKIVDESLKKLKKFGIKV